MGKFKAADGKYRRVLDGKHKPLYLPNVIYEQFHGGILGLGDIEQEVRHVDAICGVLDLTGFTKFCNQADPHLAVPSYLAKFLKYVFESIKAETLIKTVADRNLLYSKLPIFVKFMGDGLLILWDISNASPIHNFNIATNLTKVCTKYRSEFLPTIASEFIDAPPALRCGIARGRVYSVGNGEDFIGPCINIASRLVKLPGISIAIAKRGFDLSSTKDRNHYVVKTVALRGVGDNELVILRKSEIDSLPAKHRKLFADPK